MGQVVKEEAQSDAHHQGWSKPAVEYKGQETKLHCRNHNRRKYPPGNPPLQQLIAAPETPAKEKQLVVKKPWRD